MAGVVISGPALGFRGNGSSDRHCMLVIDIGEGEITPEGARRREVIDWAMLLRWEKRTFETLPGRENCGEVSKSAGLI